jgi:hypothetical protein
MHVAVTPLVVDDSMNQGVAVDRLAGRAIGQPRPRVDYARYAATRNPISGVSWTSEARTARTLSFASLETARAVLVTLDRLAADAVSASPRTT